MINIPSFFAEKLDLIVFMISTQKHRSTSKHKSRGAKKSNLLSTVPHNNYDNSKNKPFYNILSLKSSFILNILQFIIIFILFLIFLQKYSECNKLRIALLKTQTNISLLTEKMKIFQLQKTPNIENAQNQKTSNILKEIAQKDLLTLQMKYGTKEPIYVLLDTSKGLPLYLYFHH